MDALGLVQHVNFATHHSGNILDHIYMEEASSVKIIKCIQSEYISDHWIIDCKTTLEKEPIVNQEVLYCDVNSINIEDFVDDLLFDYGDTPMLQAVVDGFNKSLLKALDKHAPLVTKKIPIRQKVPWFDSRVWDQKQEMRKREMLWRRLRTDEQWKSYCTARRSYKWSVKHNKKVHISQCVLDVGKDSKLLFKIVSGLTGTVRQNPLPEHEDAQTLAEEFADYFLVKVEKISDELVDYPKYQPKESHAPKLNDFRLLSTDEILEVLYGLETKHCELDIFPVVLLKKIALYIKVELSIIVNMSLRREFLDDWKTACVKPLIKSINLDCKKESFRPVFNLSFVSKLIEKVVIKQFNEYCDINKLMPAYQSAYHRDHSCETSLLNLCDKILWRMERQHISCLLVMDQSVASDTICTDNLLQVLSKKFGIGGSALNWYDQYLRPRKFYVNIEGSKSSVCDLKTGVPQGSCSGANLFMALVSTLPDVIKTSISVQLRNASGDLHIDDVELKVDLNGFADDHSLNNGFDPSNPASEDKAVRVMEDLMQDIKEWMSQN